MNCWAIWRRWARQSPFLLVLLPFDRLLLFVSGSQLSASFVTTSNTVITPGGRPPRHVQGGRIPLWSPLALARYTCLARKPRTDGGAFARLTCEITSLLAVHTVSVRKIVHRRPCNATDRFQTTDGRSPQCHDGRTCSTPRRNSRGT